MRRTIGRVSPPTRGWTRWLRASGCYRIGFPAHAGMDLRRLRAPPPRPGFPRPRGDGPVATRRGCRQSMVSPPTRGWTLHVPSGSSSTSGFPAHAGMDPAGRRSRPECRRFPRPRGDGPRASCGWSACKRVSPPTRGWTDRVDRPHVQSVGFPAHAGMDPRAWSIRSAVARFPRPRGDGPVRAFVPVSRIVVSPPTRGWTRPRCRRALRARGFPAHAGMDPQDPGSSGICWRFPRPRGDGPTEARYRLAALGVSPPTRGWT